MNLRDDDEMVVARLAQEDDDILMVSEQGMSIRFPVSDVTPRQRAAGGVKGMELRAKDRVVSMDIAREDSQLLVISKLGYGKLTKVSEYRVQGRGGVGVKTFNIRRKTGPVAAAEIVDDSNEVYVVSEQAQVIRTNLSEIRSMGRATQGVTIFKPQEGDAVSSIACVGELDIEEKNGSKNGKVHVNGVSGDPEE
jgi:DNA gyrase subunit A